MHLRPGEIIYANALSRPEDIEGWRLEGDAAISFPQERLRAENRRDPEEGQAANFVLWCPEDFPDDITVSWSFWPVREPGLCILFFAASGRNGADLFSEGLARREGIYKQYHHGDINALHVSYFRRKALGERAFQVCNLRKSFGFHMVCQGADPLPSVADALPPYRIQVAKVGPEVGFWINDLPIFHWTDDGNSHGPVLGGGKIGFRQMAPLIGEYSDLEVRSARLV